MRILGWDIGIEKAAKKPTKQELEGERVASSVYIMPWQQNRPLPATVDNYELINSYKSWVYVCASKNAQAVAKVPLKLFVAKKNASQKLLVQTKSVDRREENRLRSISGLDHFMRKATKIEEVTEHPFFDLIQSVNPMINRFDLWELTELFLEMTGNAYWYVVKNAMDVPTMIWPIPTQGMYVVTGTGSTLVKGYVYKLGVQSIPFDYDEIVHFRFNSLKSQIYGYSPMQAAMEAYRFDERVKVFEGTLLSNMGRPEGVLQTEQPINDREYERIRTRWRQTYSGESRVGKTLILEKGLQYQPISMSPKDIQYKDGRRWSREEIAAVFGMPISKLTSENVNRANAEAGDYSYMADTIEPRLRRIEEKLNERLMPMFDPSGQLFCAYAEAVPENRDYRLREVGEHLRSAYSSINEERILDGKDPVEWGDEPLLPPGMVPLSMQQSMLMQGGLFAGGGTPAEIPEGGAGPKEDAKPQDGKRPPKKPEPVGAKPKPGVKPEPGAKPKPGTGKEVDDFADRVIAVIKQKTKRVKASV
jgi:HK97 family phage portal protein